MPFKKTIFAAGCASMLAGPAAALAAQPVTLLPHRAVYDVKLKKASERSGITSMNGRIVYEFQGSPCDGYVTNFRFVTQIGVQGEPRVTDQRTTTFEAGDGESFRFVTKTYVNDRFDKEVSGKATIADGETSIELDKPDDLELTLAPALFPTAHMLDMIKRANAGETFYEENIFDGSDEGDQVMTTTVIIGPEKQPEANETDAESPKVLGQLADDPYRSVSIAYFNGDDSNSGESLPEYGIGFKMYDNGVTRSLNMDYGDFSLEGTMTDFKVLEAESCDK